MNDYWIRLEKWLLQHAPHLIQLLNPGAAEADIIELEGIIGRKLPEDFVQFYMIHNGQNEEKGQEGLIDSEELLSITDIVREWECWKELLEDGIFEDKNRLMTSDPDNGIKNDWWNPLWIPFTYDGSGNHVCIDLDPAPGGHLGQVIRMWHDSAYRELYANSFKEYIENYIVGLETGKFVYAKNWGLVDKDSSFNKP